MVTARYAVDLIMATHRIRPSELPCLLLVIKDAEYEDAEEAAMACHASSLQSAIRVWTI
jgi:hypothetical protein